MKYIYLILFLILCSCKQEQSYDNTLVKGVWVKDSSVHIITSKLHNERYTTAFSSKEKYIALSKDRYYAYLKEGIYFEQNDSSFLEYSLLAGSNYFLDLDTMKIQSTYIGYDYDMAMVLIEAMYLAKYQIIQLDSNFMNLQYNDYFHYYTIIDRDVQVDNKNDVLLKIKEFNEREK